MFNKTKKEVLLSFDKTQIDNVLAKRVSDVIDKLDTKGLHLLNTNFQEAGIRMFKVNRLFGVYGNYGKIHEKFSDLKYTEAKNEMIEQLDKLSSN